MRRMLLGTVTVLAALNGFAQGTVFFSNRTSAGTNHISGFDWGSGMVLIGANGTSGLFGAATTFAQILAAPGPDQPEASLVPMGQTTTFRSGSAAGFLAPITATLEGIAPDAPAATLQVVAWDNSSGLYPTWTEAYPAWLSGVAGAWGKSGTFTVYSIGGYVNPPTLLPIPSFIVYATPEPSTVALVGLGIAALTTVRRRK